MSVAGVLLAAGQGSRMGRPKALVTDPDGTSWLVRSVDALRSGGCSPVTVVLGAAADDALVLVAEGVAAVVAEDWSDGMGASLRAGLRSLTEGDAALVSLVDLPDVGPDVVARVVAVADGPATLARAAYAGVPGHPVLLGSDHWDGVTASAVGDRGARDYLAAHHVTLVECGDLATGLDQDTPVSTG